MLKYYSFFMLIFASFLFAGQRDSTMIGPGVLYYSDYLEQGPWQVDVVEIDLTNEWLHFETMKADDQLYGLERTSSMAARNNSEEHRVVAAINGDFYNTANGEPLGTQIIQGEYLKTNPGWKNILFDAYNKAFMGQYTFSGSIITADTVGTLNDINRTRLDNEVILFNKYFGENTGTNQWGSELRVKILGNWAANDTLKAVVLAKEYGVGSMTTDDSTFILSGHGAGNTFLQEKINTGDTIGVYLGLSTNAKKLVAGVGGNEYLLQNGNVVGADGDRHPRTVVGFNADTTKFYFMTVDGRQAGYSIGMSYKELGDYMKSIGAAFALNLDGGGSTTMVVRGEIKNSPSDGNERSVSNSLMLISSAPTGELSHIRISPKNVYILAGLTQTFSAKGFDQYYNPLTVNPSSVTWSCSENIGTITTGGVFTAADDDVSGYVYAELNGIKDSVKVYLSKISSILLEPNPVILQAGEYQQMHATAFDNYENELVISQTDYTWEVTGDVGTISGAGLFNATATGQGVIKVSYEDVEAEVSVSVGVSQFVVIDDFTTTDKYTLTGTLVNLAECSFEPDESLFLSAPSSGRLDYSLTTGGTSALYMNCSIPISGSPDKITLNVYGDGKGHWLRGEFEDKDGEKFLVNFAANIDWTDSWKEIEINPAEASASWANPNATLEFPIKWTRIYLAETDDSKKDSGTIYFDEFKVHFITTGVDDEEGVQPDVYQLDQNYPNPFNPTTKIGFSLPEQSKVVIKVHDILGREVATLANSEFNAGKHSVEFNAAGLSSGIYFYSINAGEFHTVKKMQLLK